MDCSSADIKGHDGGRNMGEGNREGVAWAVRLPGGLHSHYYLGRRIGLLNVGWGNQMTRLRRSAAAWAGEHAARYCGPENEQLMM